MSLPFLKDKRQDGGGGQTNTIVRESDNTMSQHLLESVTNELIEAITKNDIKGMRQALQALVLMIQDKDKE